MSNLKYLGNELTTIIRYDSIENTRKDLAVVREKIEELLSNFHRYDIQNDYEWDKYFVSNYIDLKNMILNSSGYKVETIFKNHKIHAFLKICVGEIEDNKFIISTKFNNISLYIEQSYTENERNLFLNYLNTLNLKHTSCNEVKKICLFYEPECFGKYYEIFLKTEMKKIFDNNFVDKIKIDKYTGCYLCINSEINNGTFLHDNQYKNCIIIKTLCEQKNICSNTEITHEIYGKTLKEILDKFKDFINNNNLM